MPDDYVFATGRRKTSVARVRVKRGNGVITINDKTPEEYFPTKAEVLKINQPLEVSDNLGKWDFHISVKGGGYSGQAGAILHGISRALVQVDPDSKPALSKNKFFRRDSRMVERKKPGQPKARKKFQFSKR